MGFYESLDQLVGAAILGCAGAAGIGVPADVVRDGAGLSALLRARGDAEAVGGVLDALARDIWLAQETRGLSPSMAEAHAAGLVGIIADCPPDPVLLAAVRTAPDAAALTVQGIADDMLARATRSAALLPQLVPEHARFLLERTLTLLLADPQLLTGLAPALAPFLAARTSAAASPPVATAAAQTPAATSLATRPRAAALAVSSRARLTEIVARSGVEPAMRASRVEELAASIAEARRRLLATDADSGTVARLNAEAAEALDGGDLSAATQLLEQARAAVVALRREAEARLRTQIAELVAQQTQQAQATARLAEIADARLDHAAAAHLFAEAAGELPASERGLALAFRLREAEALRLDSEATGCGETLRRAAERLAEVMRRAMSAGDRDVTAAADLGLGQVLLRRAERSESAELLEASADAFRRAATTFASGPDPGRSAPALIGLGNALALIAERDSADTVHLADAAAAYHDALGHIDRQATPVRFGLTQLKLGAVLVRLGEREGATGHWIGAAGAMLEALEALEPAGVEEQAGLARAGLRRLHERLPGLLAHAQQ